LPPANGFTQGKTMTLDDLKDLLPLYVAGSLSAEQRAAVDEALKQYPELRVERRFWEGMRQATLLDAGPAEEGHLTSEQLVQYAEGMLPAGEERLHVEYHLQGCASCRDELSIVRQMPEESRTPRESAEVKKPFFFVKGSGVFRPALVFGALAIVLLGGIYLISRDQPSQQATLPPAPRETATVVPPRAEHIRRIAYVVPFSGPMREPFTTRSGTPALMLNDSIALIDLFVPVEHSAIAAGYIIHITSPAGVRAQLVDSVLPRGRGGNLDTLLVTVKREQFMPGGRYVLHVRETIKGGVTDIEPEEYRYEFDVRWSKRR
jgi:anti-sigma factor RsiW